jgi:RHS repeat-associated protein
LTGGAIGQIASSREVTSAGGNGSLGLTDTWYHYDHIGNVMNFSNSSGTLVAGSIQHQDAWGNVLSSATTGAWAAMTDGRRLSGKEYDQDIGLYYFRKRPFDSQIGRFIRPGSPYTLDSNNPILMGGRSIPVEGFEEACIARGCMYYPTGDNFPPSCHDCANMRGADDSIFPADGKKCTASCNGIDVHSWVEHPDGTSSQCFQNTTLTGEKGYCLCRNENTCDILAMVTATCAKSGVEPVVSPPECTQP